MKNFNKLILLKIFIHSIIFGQNFEMPIKFVKINQSFNIPIQIYNVTNLQSLTLEIEFDENVIQAEDIIEDPTALLGSGYYYFTSIQNERIYIVITYNGPSNEAFSGSVTIAEISFNTLGNIGDYSVLDYNEAQYYFSTVSDGLVNRRWDSIRPGQNYCTELKQGINMYERDTEVRKIVITALSEDGTQLTIEAIDNDQCGDGPWEFQGRERTFYR